MLRHSWTGKTQPQQPNMQEYTSDTSAKVWHMLILYIQIAFADCKLLFMNLKMVSAIRSISWSPCPSPSAAIGPHFPAQPITYFRHKLQ